MTDQQNYDFTIPKPPRGIKAIPWRLPIWLYRLKLGRLLGHRMLLLTHHGRISGQPRKAVLEVIRFDKETNTPYVASGFGEKSQWFQNISHMPGVNIQIGNQIFPAIAKRLTVDDAEEIFEDYHKRHPNAIKNLSKMIGYYVGDDKEKLKIFMRMIPVVAFYPENKKP